MHKLFKHSGSFAPTGCVTMPYTLCTGPLLLANSFMQWTRGGVSPQQLTVSVWKCSLVKRGVRSGLCAADTPNLTELIESSDDAFLIYNLRKRNDNRLLTIKQGRLCSCNFITRMLFKACYWLCSTSFYSRYFSLIYMYALSTCIKRTCVKWKLRDGRKV